MAETNSVEANTEFPFILDGYKVTRVLSEDGATGIVYLATAPNGTQVALKVLVSGGENYEVMHNNMKREMRILSNLTHNNVLQIVGSRLGVQWE